MSRVRAGSQRRILALDRDSRLSACLFLLLACAASPAAVAAETPIGPPGRIVRALILERRGYRIGETPPPAAVFVGTDAGVFRSDSGDGDWVAVNSGMTSLDVTALAIWQRERPVEEPVIAHKTTVAYETALYAGTRDAGVLLSTDGGLRWSPAGESPPASVHSLAADPARPGLLYAGAGEGIYRSRDSGRSWTRLSLGGDPELTFAASSISVDPGAPATIVAAGRISRRGSRGASTPAVFQSRDGGGSWSPVSEQSAGAVAVLAVDRDWPGRVYGRSASGGIVRLDARCGADGSTLCFNDGRFRVRVNRGSPSDSPADLLGAAPQTGERGSFWLERPSNIVLTIQIRDGRKINGHFWVDYDSQTSLAFTVTVTDMATGASTNYFHPEGQRTSFTDHAAF